MTKPTVEDLMKPDLTLEEVAANLVAEADEAAARYFLSVRGNFGTDSPHAFVHAYLISALFWQLDRFRFSGDFVAFYEPKHVVAEAMKQRFGMSNEDFAIDILGG